MATAMFSFSPIASFSLRPTQFYGKTQHHLPHKIFITPNYQSPTPSRYYSAVSRDDAATTPELEAEEEEAVEKRRREEEKFAVLNTGIYECRSCGYKYDESAGDPSYPIPPGFQFDKLPEDWRCPTCGAAQSFFESKMVEIAGFAQNQQYGLGGNALTSGQKTALIFGSLFLFFMLFLSGYFIQ
ncbi:Rubredoxin domain-containing protein [Hirschfeldia incana]|nr:Rubredoxin domain-containing protein [Hirschfeldia incana]